jgi:hypothetical protein
MPQTIKPISASQGDCINQPRSSRSGKRFTPVGVQAYTLLGSNQTISSRKYNNLKGPTSKIKPLKLSSLQYGSSEHFNLSVQLLFNGQPIMATSLIDSGATGNFVHTDFVKENKIPQETKQNPVPLEVADGRPISSGHITYSTSSINLVIKQDHTEELSLDIAPPGRHQVILGIPWLKKHNPAITWANHSIQFESDYCKAHCNIQQDRPRPPDSSDIKSLPASSDCKQSPAPAIQDINSQQSRQAIKKSISLSNNIEASTGNNSSSNSSIQSCSSTSLNNEDTVIAIMSLDL